MEITPTIWLIILTLGVVVLGLAMLYGRSRNKECTPAEKAYTEAATRAEYREEDSR